MLSEVSNTKNISTVSQIHRTTMASCGTVEHEPGGHYGPRFQERYELLFLRSGSLTAYVDDIQFRVEAGEVALLKPGHKEWLRFSDSSRSVRNWVTLRRDLVPSTLLPRITVAPLAIKYSSEMLDLLDAVLSLPDEMSSVTSVILDHLALTILASFLRNVEEEGAVGSTLPTAVIRSIEFMERHISQQVSLDEISSAACVTSHHLIKLFKTALGTTPVKYLWKMRSQRAAEILRTTNLSISEVAYLVGYQSPFHFSRTFRIAHGRGPKAYRQSIRLEECGETERL